MDAIFEDLFAGRIRNLDLFRWLLAMALQGDDDRGVCLNRVWRRALSATAGAA